MIEAIAAVRIYSMNKIEGEDENIIVIDIGGSTLQVTLINILEGNINVEASSVDHNLGG
jgi:molecular chaperone DnaK (HSP70)